MLHILGMSLPQVVRRGHSRGRKGHVTDGTTFVPVLPVGAFLLALLCAQNHRVAEVGKFVTRRNSKAFKKLNLQIY